MAHSDPPLISIETDTITCPICFENYMHPKTLSCGHSLCLDPCLRNLAKMRPVQCPLCRKNVDMPPSGRVEDLPTNYVVKNLLETARATEEKGATALEDDGTSWIDKGSGESCSDHGETFDFFCKTCDAVVCSKCLLSTHKVGHHRIVAAAEWARENIDVLLRAIDELDRIQTGDFRTDGMSFRALERIGSYYQKVPRFRKMLASLISQKEKARQLSSLLVEDLCRCDFRRVKQVEEVTRLLASTEQHSLQAKKVYSEIQRDISRVKKFGMAAAVAVGFSFGIPFIPL